MPGPVSLLHISSDAFSRLLTGIKKGGNNLSRVSLNYFDPRHDFPEARFLAQHYRYQPPKAVAHEVLSKRVTFLCEALRNNRTVRELELVNNRLGDPEVAKIADMLKANQTIRSLNLSRNPITIQGVKHLSDMLARNNSLISLYLGYINLNFLGLDQLVDGVEKSRSLTELYLYGNCGIRSKASMQRIGELLKHRADMRVINLNYIRFAESELTILHDALKHHKAIIGCGLLTTNPSLKASKLTSDIYAICQRNQNSAGTNQEKRVQIIVKEVGEIKPYSKTLPHA